ncbi:peptide-methionine (S)-S-oxide reductase MsrA [Neorhizobium phenanthreniclasticum]
MQRRSKMPRLAGAASVLVVLAFGMGSASAQEGIAIPAPAIDHAPNTTDMETAIFAGGCFWGVQGVFQHVEGVTNAVSGYAGGTRETAHYEMVGYGRTGHAESVKVTFDPKRVSYGHLLQIYFSVAHDPTQIDRQGPDAGPQYRSAIFPVNDEQARIAKAYIDQLDKAKLYDTTIATTIEPGKAFYPAEDYHQDFLANNPTYPYIVFNDLPKLSNLRKLFPKDYRADPVLVTEAGVAN